MKAQSPGFWAPARLPPMVSGIDLRLLILRTALAVAACYTARDTPKTSQNQLCRNSRFARIEARVCMFSSPKDHWEHFPRQKSSEGAGWGNPEGSRENRGEELHLEGSGNHPRFSQVQPRAIQVVQSRVLTQAQAFPVAHLSCHGASEPRQLP